MTYYRRGPSKYPPPSDSFTLFARVCKRAGNRNMVDELLDPFRLMAAKGETGPSVIAAMSLFHRRPWYSASELAALWPMISVGLCGKERAVIPDAAKVETRLSGLLPVLKKWNGDPWFLHNGVVRQWFIVQDVRKLSRERFTQEDFDRVMRGAGYEPLT